MNGDAGRHDVSNNLINKHAIAIYRKKLSNVLGCTTHIDTFFSI